MFALFKKAKLDELRGALTEANGLIQLHSLKIAHLEELDKGKTKTIEKLTVERDTLLTEVKSLRDLITFNQIPPILKAFVEEIGNRNFQAIGTQAASLAKIEGTLEAIVVELKRK